MEIFLTTISALNDETRIKILRFIDENGSMCVCDLQESFKMIQSRLSRHLKILKEAGFLRVERRGTWAYDSIRTPLDRFRIQVLDEIKTLTLTLPQFKKCSSNTEGCEIQ